MWVDALCIVRDDPLERSQEISSMSRIYEDSYATLVAATATSAKDGFLHPNHQLNQQPPKSAIRLRINEEFCSKPRDTVLVPSHGIDPGRFPINDRGWAFQESLIPHRLLVFGDQEPFLRCRSDDLMCIRGSLVEPMFSNVEPTRLYTQVGLTVDYPKFWVYVVDRLHQTKVHVSSR
jgi:hypothetical protein